MRLLGWLKKDSKSKRRQSAPPTGQGFDPNATRNPEYIRALATFNEWRAARLEIGNQTSIATNTSGSLLTLSIPEDSGSELPMIASRTNNAKAGNRLSLPAGTFSHDADSPKARPSCSKSKRRPAPKIPLHETSIVEERQDQEDEILQFEQQHCRSVGAFELSGDEYSHSPPTRFYKKNAKPYHERLFAKTPTATTPVDKSTVVDIEYATPQRRNNAPSKPTRRKKSNATSGPIPKIRNSLNCSKSRGTETDSMSEASHFNGSYKNYEINSSSMYDEYVISSKGYKGNLNRSAHTYQHVLNKHGDLVEYALPLVEEDKVIEATSAITPPTKSNCHTKDDSRLIDENFKFLTDKCNLNFSDSVRKFIFDEPSPSHASKNLQITDLDKSEMERKDDSNNRREIFSELDALGKWADSIAPAADAVLEEEFNLKGFLLKGDTIVVPCPKEVICRTSVLRSAIPMPVELTSGIFRNTNVSVRKHSQDSSKSIHYSQEALRRDFSALKQVRHPDIILLMAVVADQSVSQMQLILEPFDFSLNYYIHCQNNELSLANVMIVMQQMAQGVNYLQGCGYIHSNISSHSVLMRQNPFCVKLGFFELATDTNSKARREVLTNYGNMMDTSGQDFNTIPDYSLLLRGSEKYAKEKYVKLSKNINLSKVNQSTYRAYPAMEVPSKYLPYFLEYRQQFSLYFYQAPELISTKSRFVLPNTFSDVYSLTLLMWELLNNCVPYVIYSYTELDKLYKTKQVMLPNIRPERCGRFETILKMGLEKDPVQRVMSIQDFTALLDDLKASLPNVYDVVKKAEPVNAADLIDEIAQPVAPKEKHNVNEVIHPKLAIKAPFAFRKETPPRNNHYENLMPDPQLRSENAITNNISMETFETKSTTTCADFSCAFSETPLKEEDEAERRTVQRTNGELSGGLGKGYTPKAKRRNSFVGRKSIAKKPSPTKNKSAVKRSADNLFNLSQSTIFNSVSDIAGTEHSPQLQQHFVGERSSTLKRRKPVARTPVHVANVFAPKPRTRLNLEDQLKQMDRELRLSKEDLLEEFKNSPRHSVDPNEFQQQPQVQSAGPRVNPHKGMVARARAMYMKRLMYNSNNGELGPGDQLLTPTNRIPRGVPKSAPAAYKLPAENREQYRTPIARNNQLLKHAWLSDQKLDDQPPKVLEFEMSKSTDDILNRSFTIETQVADELKARNILSVEKVYRNSNSSSCNISLDDSFKEKNVNVNLKIIHNNLEIFNNSMTSPGDLSQKIQKIQLGMFEKEGCDSANIQKPEIKIRLTPGKNGSLALNDLNGEYLPIGQQITDLTSEIRQRFENYECDLWDKGTKKKLLNELVTQQPLSSPQLIQESRKVSQTDNEFRFENSLWHKEKSICESNSHTGNNDDDSQGAEWISVPLAIKRFESISKSQTESPKSNNKSSSGAINPAELSIVQQSRLPCGGDAENSVVPVRATVESDANGPAATSSPLVEDSIRRFNSYLRPIRLLSNQSRPSLGGSTQQCCSSRNVVRRATFNEGPGQANRSRRITTKVTLNLKKVQPIGSVNSSRTSEFAGARNESLVCTSCGTNVTGNLTAGVSNANLSTSLISYSTLSRPHDKHRDALNRRSSSCSTLLKMDDLYIDDDFEDNCFLTPNIDLVNNEFTNLYVD